MATETSISSTQYLSFTLGNEIFALEIAKVREVLDLTSITKVPQTPEFMRGVINLRGGVVPVVDLRLKFGMPRT
ncbi:MAG: chemotaxis protein CheW, partial [Nitrospirota bacterium]